MIRCTIDERLCEVTMTEAVRTHISVSRLADCATIIVSREGERTRVIRMSHEAAAFIGAELMKGPRT